MARANVYLVPFWRVLVLAAMFGKLAVGFKRPATPPVTSLREVLLDNPRFPGGPWDDQQS